MSNATEQPASSVAFVPGRVWLGTWPTPVEPAPRLAAEIGLNEGDLWIKRDDLSGLGGGGNKVRKLEWTVAAAIAEGADTLVTSGGVQSNHARLTAAAGARLGLTVVLVFPGTPPTQMSGNLTLDGLFGASIAWVGEFREEVADGLDEDAALAAVADIVASRLRASGRRPAVIPFGGSNATGAHGYRLAAAEITDQVSAVDHVVVALGSGGTMAGLVAALGPERVLGVHTAAVADPHRVVGDLLGSMPEVDVDLSRLRIRTDQVGAGYSALTPGAGEALTLMGRTEGIALDPIYTARALSGLRTAIADGDVRRSQKVVFLHSGGLPGLFGHAAATELGNAQLRRVMP
jgi:L-cysteate sulfo-lyase